MINQPTSQAGAGGTGAYLAQMLSQSRQDSLRSAQQGDKGILNQLPAIGRIFGAGDATDAMLCFIMSTAANILSRFQTYFVDLLDLGSPVGNVELLGRRITGWDLITGNLSSENQDNSSGGASNQDSSGQAGNSDQSSGSFVSSVLSKIPSDMLGNDFKIQDGNVPFAKLGTLSPDLPGFFGVDRGRSR
ncbi:hypothetical protein RLOatenuis_2220 [Rickettsiales bacterium]|nr:hypothetical protein RLOatenuis_2220 [Rickettsiales bacterium]